MKAAPTLLALTFGLAANASHAAPSILGVEVGAALTLPECVASDTMLIPHDCWKSDPHPWPPQARELFLSEETKARMRFVRQATVIMEGNSVGGLIVETTGIESQDNVVRALSAEFGRPTRYTGDRAHAKPPFDGISAAWSSPGLIVHFTDMFDDDHGEIDMMTPAYAKHRFAKVAP
jgi:hypothetical protein